MAIEGVTPTGWILALFIRDDGQRFVLGDGAYQFTNSQLHFTANTLASDTIEVQGDDGYLLAGQVERTATQSFDGYIGDGTTARGDIEMYRQQFIGFFARSHYYTVVYVYPDSTAMQRKYGFIVDAPEVKELYQHFPEFHVALSFENPTYYSYDEDDEGEEIYAAQLTLAPTATQELNGGLVWDAVGVVWHNDDDGTTGAEWEDTENKGYTVVTSAGVGTVYPIWTVVGPVANPVLTNISNGLVARYNGTIALDQTLVVDMDNRTVTLDGEDVYSNFSGDWLALQPGENHLTYVGTSVGSNTTIPDCYLSWQEVLG